jgi:hypothetical protein
MKGSSCGISEGYLITSLRGSGKELKMSRLKSNLGPSKFDASMLITQLCFKEYI